MNNITKGLLLTPFNLLYKINPVLELKLLFRLKCGYKLNLDNPTTYNEKLQWIKLYDKNPLMPKCCDKFTVRDYVKSKGCKNILNNLIWEGFNPNDIPFDKLPKKCVIKVTHGSTFNIICEDSSKLNRKEVISKCNKWLKTKFLPCYGEWFYGIEKPRIIVEEYLDGGSDGLKDYKVYCFNGVPKYISVDSGRQSNKHTKNIYDSNWNLMENYEMAFPCSNIPDDKPSCLNELLNYAIILSKDFLHARVDFYIVNKKIIFGEITFTNSAGFGNISPYKFNKEMGNFLKLSSNT